MSCDQRSRAPTWYRAATCEDCDEVECVGALMCRVGDVCRDGRIEGECHRGSVHVVSDGERGTRTSENSNVLAVQRLTEDKTN